MAWKLSHCITRDSLLGLNLDVITAFHCCMLIMWMFFFMLMIIFQIFILSFLSCSVSECSAHSAEPGVFRRGRSHGRFPAAALELL